MGQIKNTDVKYKDEDLRALGVNVKMPALIQTIIVLKEPIHVEEGGGALTDEVCVSTSIDYKGGFFGMSGEAGETLVFPAKNGKKSGSYELKNMPADYHEKNAWAAIKEHQKICVGIAEKY